MPAFSFVHTADLHLDSPFSALRRGNKELADALRSATFRAFDAVLQLCLDRHADFLLVAGDVFDGEDRSIRAQIHFREGLAGLSREGIRTFVVHGNHDPLDTWSTTVEWPEGVHIFGADHESLPLVLGGRPAACIQGISHPTRNETRNLARLFRREGKAFNIGLLHADVGTNTGHEPYAPCTLGDLLEARMDYWALGHVHGRRVLSAEAPPVVYPGSPQGRNIREAGAKGCYLVQVEEDHSVSLEFHATDVVRWETGAVSIQGLESQEDLLGALDRACSELLERGGGRPTLARLLVRGRGPLYSYLKRPGTQGDLLEVLQDRGMSFSPFLWVERVDIDVSPSLDLEAWAEEQDFLGELLRYAREVRNGGDLRAALRKDLGALYDHSTLRRHIPFPDDRRLREFLRAAEEICAEGLLGEEEP